MKSTKIEYVDATVNPVVGCTFGCPYCYARKMNDRFSFVPDFSKPQFFPERLKQLETKKPKIVFMDSMSDIADWPKEAMATVRKALSENPQHVYMFLTKRPCIGWNVGFNPQAQNIWIGTSITSTKDMHRIDELQLRYPLNPPHLFLSIEPIHGSLGIEDEWFFEGIGWIIIGAETGNRKGKVIPQKEWVAEIVQWARYNGIPVFMKDSLVPIMGEENMLREFPEAITEWIKEHSGATPREGE